jgi:hypothetical protein
MERKGGGRDEEEEIERMGWRGREVVACGAGVRTPVP